MGGKFISGSHGTEHGKRNLINSKAPQHARGLRRESESKRPRTPLIERLSQISQEAALSKGTPFIRRERL